jgi:hypothetical protein
LELLAETVLLLDTERQTPMVDPSRLDPTDYRVGHPSKRQSVSFANYQYELPERFVRDSNSKLGLPENAPIETWSAKNAKGQAEEIWIITKVEDPKLVEDLRSDPQKALKNSTSAWNQKQKDWNLKAVAGFAKVGSIELSMSMIKTLTMVGSGEVIGFTAGFVDGDQAVIIYCFEIVGDTVKQANELQASLDTIKKK